MENKGTKWIAIIGSILGIFTAVITILTFLGFEPFKIFFRAKPERSIAIVFDGSEAMNRLFDNGETKFAVAKEAVIRKVAETALDFTFNDNIGFRIFGGPCDEGQKLESVTNLAVGFGQGKRNRRCIKNTLGDLEPSKKSWLIKALLEALLDLKIQSQKHQSITTNKIVLITGSNIEDFCEEPRLDLLKEKLDEMEYQMQQKGGQFKMDITFIAMRVTTQDDATKAFFKNIEDTTGGLTFFVDNRYEFDLALLEPPGAREFFLAKKYYDTEDDSTAAKHFKKAGQAEIGEAWCYLGDMMATHADDLRAVKEKMAKKYDEKAVTYYTLGVNAKKKSVKAMVSLGFMYIDGKGVGKDIEENFRFAEKYFTKAADSGDSQAKVELGLLKETGQNGLSPDPKLARSLYEEAAQKGNPEGMENFARVCEKGIGGPPNLPAALSSYQRADSLGELFDDGAIARVKQLIEKEKLATK